VFFNGGCRQVLIGSIITPRISVEDSSMTEPSQLQPQAAPAALAGVEGHAPVLLTKEEIFRKYAPRVYHLARRMLGNDNDAEDVTQEVFVKVLRNLPTFRGEAAFSTWLYRIAVNTTLTYRRKRAIRKTYSLVEPFQEFADNGEYRYPVRRWAPSPEQLALDREAHQVIENAIGQLPETYRDVYVLADVEGLANNDIADILGLSVAAVKCRLHRARVLMRNLLAPYFEEKCA
jgi:RNA polymerase sigma-70 factor, ECF subfamily